MHLRSGFVFVIILVIIIGLVFSIEESRTFLVALLLRIFLFVKQHLIALLAAFFFVKGKFILTLFLKKVAFLSFTGLSKRYFIEKVINHNLKIHFLDHIMGDIKRLMVYIKKNFKNFPIIKQIIAVFVFLASLGFVGKFMGWMFAVKVFIAKFWSFMLALLLKSSTAITYFFTEYLWDSWIAPLIEVLIFSWVLDLMERVPFLKKYIQKIYRYLIELFEWFEYYMQKVLHIPLKRFFKFLTRGIKRYINRFIGANELSARERLQELRRLYPSAYVLLKRKHKERIKHRGMRQRRSFYDKFKQQRRLSKESVKYFRSRLEQRV